MALLLLHACRCNHHELADARGALPGAEDVHGIASRAGDVHGITSRAGDVHGITSRAGDVHGITSIYKTMLMFVQGVIVLALECQWPLLRVRHPPPQACTMMCALPLGNVDERSDHHFGMRFHDV